MTDKNWRLHIAIAVTVIGAVDEVNNMCDLIKCQRFRVMIGAKPPEYSKLLAIFSDTAMIVQKSVSIKLSECELTYLV